MQNNNNKDEWTYFHYMKLRRSHQDSGACHHTDVRGRCRCRPRRCGLARDTCVGGTTPRPTHPHNPSLRYTRSTS